MVRVGSGLVLTRTPTSGKEGEGAKERDNNEDDEEEVDEESVEVE